MQLKLKTQGVRESLQEFASVFFKLDVKLTLFGETVEKMCWQKQMLQDGLLVSHSPEVEHPAAAMKQRNTLPGTLLQLLFHC
jgi:hypothetical protein